MKLKAFTLIELIVVIAIIAVLAAILIPSMVNYVSDSKVSTANSNAKLAYTNSATYCTRCETSGRPMAAGIYNSMSLSYQSSPPDYVTNGSSAELQKALQNMMGTTSNKAGVCSVKISGSVPVDAVWAKDASDVFVGRYPEAVKQASEASLTLT
ncbi:MAG: prepilin-type N-terminal cleavage/methylation domain-containing protein [Ruminococcus sp.]|nr:prepilin-type N-terminal cleavage/methylation domain-containing protein [Ruminococcus sp.]